jgi:hypothetical protein
VSDPELARLSMELENKHLRSQVMNLKAKIGRAAEALAPKHVACDHDGYDEDCWICEARQALR